MEIVVESIMGRRRIFSNVSSQETIRGMKTRLWKLDGVPVSRQSFVYRNEALDDDKTLDHYRIVDGAIIKLVLITRSGPINKPLEPPPKKLNLSLPSTSSIGPRGEADGENSSAASSIRRYTRQQMRQVQLAGACSAPATSLPEFPVNEDPVQRSSSFLIEASALQDRQRAAASRADENYRTMQRMRELRRSIERLNLEKSQNNGQRQQRNSQSGCSGTILESGPATRCRRPTGGYGSSALQNNGASGSSTSGLRARSSNQVTVTGGDRYSAAAAAARAAYAADDTSAKESSAGETEIEEAGSCRQLNVNSSTSSATKSSAPIGSSASRSKAQTSSQLMPPVGFKSKHQLFRNIRRSSCSDVDVESSAVWSSDPETDGVFHNERSHEQLYTADDWSLEGEEWDAICDQGDAALKAMPVVDSSDYEDATGGSGRPADDIPPANEGRSSSADDDKASVHAGGPTDGMVGKQGQDISSDPSELSSGVVICELAMAMNNRRLKVKRKTYHAPRHGYKRPSTMLNSRGGGVMEETDDQSPLESPVKCCGLNDGIKLLPPRFLHQNISYRDHLNSGYAPVGVGCIGGSFPRNWHRARPRSKQRLPVTVCASTSTDQQTNVGSTSGQQLLANNSTTTGDSSSDEREGTSRKETQAANAPSLSFSNTASSTGRSACYGHKQPQSSQSQQRCNACACRLSIATTFQCRCGKTVCLRHRYADLHACSLLATTAVPEKK